jgi:hypothetical protein
MPPPLCFQIPGCGKRPYCRELCREHYEQRLEQHPPCIEPGCTALSWSSGLCRVHYNRYLRSRSRLTVTSWHEQSDPVPAQQGLNGCYDRRFVGAFLHH